MPAKTDDPAAPGRNTGDEAPEAFIRVVPDWVSCGNGPISVGQVDPVDHLGAKFVTAVCERRLIKKTAMAVGHF